MKSSTYIIIVALIAVGIVAFFIIQNKEELPPLTNYSGIIPANTTIVVFGDSLAYGYGAKEGNALPNQLQKLLGVPVVNLGVSGNTTGEALSRISDIPKNTYLTVVIAGGNDVLRKVTPQETYSNMRSIISTLQEQGSIVAIASVKSSIFGDGPLSEEYALIAEETGSLYLGNILTGVFGNKEYMYDTIHPNDAGYTLIAESIAIQIKPYLE